MEVEVRWHKSEKVKQRWRLSDRQHSLQLHTLPAFPPFFPSFPPLPACLSVCWTAGEKKSDPTSLQKGGVKLSGAVKLKTLVEVLQNSGALSFHLKKVRD